MSTISSSVIRRRLVAVSSIFLLASMLAPPTQATPVPGQAAAGQPNAVRATTAPPSPFAQASPRVVTISSGWYRNRPGKRNDVPRSPVRVLSDGTLKLTMKHVRKAEVVTEGLRRYESKKEQKRWASLGASPIGVVSGVTSRGQRIQVPVVFRSMTVKGSTATVLATPTGGAVAAIAAPYVPHLKGVADPTMAWGNYNNVSITGWPSSARTWRFGTTGKGYVDVQGDNVSVVLTPDSARAGGVQPSGQSASTSWDHIVANWDKYAGQGAPAKVVVSGLHKKRNGKTVAENGVLLVKNVVKLDGKVVVYATIPPKPDGVKKMAVVPRYSQRHMTVTLETPAGGTTTSYVVVAGDSIASGEGARFGGTYINPALQKGTGSANTPTPREVADRTSLFCDSVDLACTSADVGADGKVTYQADPGLVYEKGSFEGAEKCHRSKTAPGTWLARYYATQLGLDVQPITIACSGATTASIIDASFKGQAPQAQDLKALAAWLPVSDVVVTIGANDIKFAEIALKCLTAPVDAILGGAGPGGLDVTTALASIGKIFDDVRRSNGSVESANPFFNPNELCSESIRPSVEKALAEVRGRVAAAMSALHAVAPRARVVLSNYPSLVPASTKTYFPRQEWFETYRPVVLGGGLKGGSGAGDLNSWVSDLNARGSAYWPNGVFPTVAPQEPFFDGVAAGNEMNNLIGQNVYNGLAPTGLQGQELAGSLSSDIVQSWGFDLIPLTNILGYGATMFGFDQDWAANEVLPGLNAALIEALRDADPSGAWSIPVDQTQTLNGRELGSKFVGHTDGPFFRVWGSDGTGAGPIASRGQMVNNIFAGQQLPFVCPGPDSVTGTAGPACIGEPQEALHPNWRGQAAQGQCIVAVATGAFGGAGNACVRSVGDGTAPERTYLGASSANPFDDLIDPTLFSEVNGDDSLCLISLDQAAGRTPGQYTACSSSTAADPTWDAERWEQGRVSWKGTKVVWR